MFEIGFWEILLILVLALVIIGPERLPSAARKAGYYVGKARRYVEGVRSEVEAEFDITEFKRMLHNQEVQINELQQQLKNNVDDVKSDFLTDVPSHSFYDEPAETEGTARVANKNEDDCKATEISSPANQEKS